MKMTLERWNRMIAELRRKAETGDPQAQWELGSWIEDGFTNRKGKVIVPKNRRAALAWFRLSAEGGNAFGQNALGIYLSGGICTQRDDAQALFWYKCALRNGSSISAANIACVYRDRGDHRRAFFWRMKAVKSGDGDVLVDIGTQYYNGEGVRRDVTLAVSCFRKAIRMKKAWQITQAGRELAMFRLGIAYREGKGVRQSNAKALEWISLANQDDDIPGAGEMIRVIQLEMSGKSRKGISNADAPAQVRRGMAGNFHAVAD